MIDTIFSLEPPVALCLYHSRPYLIGRVAVVAFHFAQLNVSVGPYAHLSLQPAHLLQVRAVFGSLAPNDISVQLVALQQKEELLAVGLVLVVMVDRGGFSVEDPHVLLGDQDVVDDFDASLLVHPSGQLFPPAERTQDGFPFLLVLDGPDAVAAKLMFAL